MRDVWVVFLAHDARDQEIVNLRDRMTKGHTMLYESITDTRDLNDKLTERLRSWTPAVGVKTANFVDLLPSSGKDVLRASRLRIEGQTLVELGHPEAGLDSLKRAALIGGPVEQLAYSKQQARSGDVRGAIASAQEAINYFISGQGQLHTPLAAEAFAAQAGFYRRQGLDLKAAGRLEHALTLASGEDPSTVRVRCRILDELGLAHQTLDNLDEARKRFKESLDARIAADLKVDVAQSRVNLARLELASGNSAAARQHADLALGILHGLPPNALQANAEVLIAQLRISKGDPEGGFPHAQRALAINQQIANRRGEAISHLVLARCSRCAGNASAATQHALASLEVNRDIGDEFGMKQATQFLDEFDG